MFVSITERLGTLGEVIVHIQVVPVYHADPAVNQAAVIHIDQLFVGNFHEAIGVN